MVNTNVSSTKKDGSIAVLVVENVYRATDQGCRAARSKQGLDNNLREHLAPMMSAQALNTRMNESKAIRVRICLCTS
jgi:hypothetical protein